MIRNIKQLIKVPKSFHESSKLYRPAAGNWTGQVVTWSSEIIREHKTPAYWGSGRLGCWLISLWAWDVRFNLRAECDFSTCKTLLKHSLNTPVQQDWTRLTISVLASARHYFFDIISEVMTRAKVHLNSICRELGGSQKWNNGLHATKQVVAGRSFSSFSLLTELSARVSPSRTLFSYRELPLNFAVSMTMAKSQT